MTLLGWLREPWLGPGPFGGPVTPGLVPAVPTRLQVYVALCSMNGGGHVHGWGVQTNDGLYGRSGLEQEEALCLISLHSFINGWCAAAAAAGQPEERALREAVSAELARVRGIVAASIVEDGRGPIH